ncbi:hypothetical protein F6455_15415 [Proteobacteria bacterium 005FR1]|nr:hypothetical protein [Proteobacteria bacterium 005FR1]
MTETPLQHLLHQLEHLHPDRVLVAADHIPDTVEHWAEVHHSELTRITSRDPDWSRLGRYQFAIVADYLEHLHKSEGLKKLAQLRNLHSERIWVLVNKAGPWTFADFISLGFRRYAEFESDLDEPPMVCYGYDLASYNHVRTWNNPRFWANPENWNKYWW